jgi:Glycosyl transferase family 2
MVTSRMHAETAAETNADETPWAHASGWAQLSGLRRNVSCVVLGLAEPEGVAEIFDSLSDALTEAGYPWEILMVDVGASRPLSELLTAWSERPGFRRITLPPGTLAALALTHGLEKARGDAVLLMEARGADLAVPIPEMVSQWSDGVEIVKSKWLAAGHASSAGTTARPDDGLGHLLGEYAVLLDRRTVELLLGEAR